MGREGEGGGGGVRSALTSGKRAGEQGGKDGEMVWPSPGTAGHCPASQGGASGTPRHPSVKPGALQAGVPPAPRMCTPRNEPRILGESRSAVGPQIDPGWCVGRRKRVCRSCASNLLSVDFQAQLFDAINATFFFFFFFNLNSVCLCVNMQQVVYYIPRLLFYHGLFL